MPYFPECEYSYLIAMKDGIPDACSVSLKSNQQLVPINRRYCWGFSVVGVFFFVFVDVVVFFWFVFCYFLCCCCFSFCNERSANLRIGIYHKKCFLDTVQY